MRTVEVEAPAPQPPMQNTKHSALIYKIMRITLMRVRQSFSNSWACPQIGDWSSPPLLRFSALLANISVDIASVDQISNAHTCACDLACHCAKIHMRGLAGAARALQPLAPPKAQYYPHLTIFVARQALQLRCVPPPPFHCSFFNSPMRNSSTASFTVGGC